MRVSDVGPDEQLMLQRIARGDSAALGALYDRYATTLYSLGIRMLGDAQAAEELVQEVLIRVWRQATSYSKERGAPSTWIFGIARNLAIDELRRRGARPQTAVDDAEVYIAQLEADDDPVEQVSQRMQHDEVVRALDQLSSVQRRVLELAYYNGLSQSEIAAQLGDPLGTVKTRMRTGLQRLRTLLDGSGRSDEAL